MKILKLGGALLAGLALAASPVLASSASAATSTVGTVGSCTARGDFAICTASGTARHPVTIRVHVVARPGQRVSGSWSMTCAKGNGAGSKSGNIGGWAGPRNPRVRSCGCPTPAPTPASWLPRCSSITAASSMCG